MRIYDSAFYGIIFFIFGVFLSSLGLNLITIVFIAFLSAGLFLAFGFFKKASLAGGREKIFWLAALSFFIAVGSFYYFVYETYQYQNAKIIFGEKIDFIGVFIKITPQNNSQKLTVDLASPLAGKISVQARPFPKFEYGDLAKFNGTIKIPAQSSASYLSKEGILGESQYPQIELMASGQGSAIKASLFSFKEKIVNIFQKIFPEEQAAFLSGITLGERAEFSKEFRNLMSKSGTTHLVALSGYNISILVMVVSGALGYLFSRRVCFWLTFLVIIGFVLMTGAEASVVRAAIMGSIILLSSRVGRAYSFRNIIAAAAFLMVLANPKVLVFDVGFQLSFLALMGIVYFSPAIKKFLKIENDESLLSWKENLLATFSAQVFVAPLLISYFGNFSFLSLAANVLVLSVIPLTMALGFVAAGIGLLSLNFAVIFGWLVNILASYEIAVIKIFGRMDFLQITEISVPLAIIYYFLLGGFIVYAEYRFDSVNTIKRRMAEIS